MATHSSVLAWRIPGTGEPGGLPSMGSHRVRHNWSDLAAASHASKVLLKILQIRLQQCVNQEIPNVQAGFRTDRGTRDQIANIDWIIEKAREFQKNIYFCFIDCAKAFNHVDHNKLWKIFKEMGISDHLTCFLRNLYLQVKMQQNHTWNNNLFQIGKRVCQGCILSLCLFNLYAEYIMWNAGLDEAQAGIKIPRRNIKQLQICRWHHPCGRKQRGTKEPLDESERGEWKSCLKLNIQKMKIMTAGPITSWQINGKQWKQWQTLFSWTPKSLQKVTAAMKLKDTCSL